MPRVKKNIRDIKNKIKAPRPAGMISKLKGIKDVLPDDYKYWKLVTKKAVELSKIYGFKRMEIPFLENLALYEKACGKGSSFVGKEVITFLNKKNDKIALRPDIMPGLIRAGIEHSLFENVSVVKTFCLGPVVRYDQLQAGRMRQYNQFNLDIFGDFGSTADAQLILIAYNFFKELQLDVEVQINSLGCPDCRKEYIEKILETYKERGKKTKLCVECKKNIIKNPMQLLKCQEEKCLELSADIPPTVDHLCDGCREHFVSVLEQLDNLSVPYNLNHRLVSIRGIDCYDGTVFELIPTVSNGKQSASLGGGGNYSRIVQNLGEEEVAGCGFSIDIEKTISKIRSNNIAVENEDRADVFIAQLSNNAKQRAMLIFEELRRSGFRVREHFIKDNLKEQLEEAEKINVRYTLILGQKELQDNMILIRDMESGAQEFIDIKKIVSELDKRLNIN